ncbi:helicase-exonuclease AddAB subunit AddB [Clostridium perfringens]|uniref:ATP-dependent helicase/deoxyribonuclease subunit B n=1 Tax=Clostridium perfringens F262 TaxID=883064 RepID=A0AAV3FHB9_CLOPF|nr:helicase-exonuclease AddAB subunit AddB [Clostridium perfringens]EIA18699.1 ATP-dependent helicase/deoxyribonuclease subunit B [Clostridium perfringens F262]ELC8368207.1 helicase-exonuclease AddAB subunit AddB [Clostridium perfringens]MBO3345009.1 helicase-exonuclease AddAB subunit AddB [Clostridium perfringens]MBO3348098.1 helicase-exonuclease AddAB subunit AddB [Clostridium perfringens]MBO3351151.1 helicase-exonuclease AddAB subunit AddB [Clostridium perfringens]
MGLKIIYGRAGTGKSTFCINQIKKKINNSPTNKLILLVPEQFTFQTENKVLSAIGERYVLNAEVLSFKRLAHNVFNECGGATRTIMGDAGKSMLIFKVLEDLGDNMTVFKNASRQKGFIDIASKTITEFKKYNVNNEVLDLTINEIEDENLKMKMEELKDVFNEFNSRLHEGYVDEEDQLLLLNEKLDGCSLYDGAEIWIDEFSSFTPNQLSVIGKLLKRAKSVNITLSIDEVNSPKGESDLFVATKNTEKRLMNLIQEEGIAFNGYINLNEDIPYRFKENKELAHIERQLYAYPFKQYRGKNNSLRLYRANNNYDEIEFVAKDILRLVREKQYRFKDISVICREVDNYEKVVSAIFAEYEIPYYIDKKIDIASNPLIVYINSAVDIISKNWTYESMFKYLKTGLIKEFRGVEGAELIDELENYILAYGIKGKKWMEEWVNYSSSILKEEEISEENKQRLERLNDIRETIVTPLDEFNKQCKGKKTLKEFATILYEFLDSKLDIMDTIDKYVEYFKENDMTIEAKEYSEVRDIFIDVLEQAVDVLGNEVMDLNEFMKVLNIGLSQYEMGLIPVALDQVNIGDITRIKSRGTKALYIIGVNDGVLPSASKEEGILSDNDREILLEKGISLASDTRTKIFEEQFLVYTAFTIAEEYLVVTYPLADFEGKSQRPSIIVHRLKKILPNVKEESEGFKLVDDKYEKISAKIPTLNELMIAIRKNYDGADIEDYWKYVYDWYLREPKWKERIEYVRKGLEYTNLENNISKEKAKKLYEDNKNKISLSVSRLERYAQCPFAYYIQYGLKAKDRKIYEFTAPDLGSFMHEILDEFTNEIKEKDLKWSDLSKENCRNIVNSLVDNQVKNNKSSILNSSKRYSYFTDRFKRILTKSVMVISEQMKRSDFEIYKNELAFGFSKDVNSIKLDLPSGESFYLNGRIDRVDKLNLDGETYLRIIDYKTGSKKFDLNKFYNGLQMQLLVYLDALINNSENIVENQAMPGAILYFRIDDPILKSKGDLTEEEIKSEVLKELKLEGLLLDDVKVVKAMDTTLEPGTHSLIIPANMKKAGDLGKNKALITMEQFELLRKYVNEKMVEICQNMIEGKIDIEPCKENKNIVCDYCNYSHICQFDSSLEDNRYKVIPKKKDEEIWKSINEKVGGEVNGD